jgi:hypothetical protein
MHRFPRRRGAPVLLKCKGQFLCHAFRELVQVLRKLVRQNLGVEWVAYDVHVLHGILSLNGSELRGERIELVFGEAVDFFELFWGNDYKAASVETGHGEYGVLSGVLYRIISA